MKALHAVPILLAVAAAVPQTVRAQPTFIRMGAPNTYVTGFSADGSVVVGVYSHFGPAFRWSNGALENIGGDGFQAKISRDGKVIISDAKDSQGITSAAIWMGGTNWKTLGGVPNGKEVDNVISSAWGVSGDGSIIAGLAWINISRAHGFAWNATDGMIDLGSLQGNYSRASAISGNGHVIAGWDANPRPSNYPDWRGTVWFESAERLVHPFGWIGAVEGLNDTGQAMVGRGCPANSRHAYLYTADDGKCTDLGAIPRGITAAQREQEDQSLALAVSDDASVVVGESGWKPPRDAFIWIKGEGKMKKLQDYLLELGTTGLTGWRLLAVGSISPDGKIIGGIGSNPLRQVEGWLVKLP